MPVPPAVSAALESTHSAETLARARYVVGDPRIALPDAINLVEGWSGWGHAVVVDDIIVFDRDPGTNIRWWSHELTHVKQFAELGVEKFSRLYIQDHRSLEDEANTYGELGLRRAGYAESRQDPVLLRLFNHQIPLRVYAHVEARGDVGPFTAAEWAGVREQSLRLEHVRLECDDPDVQVEVMAHLEAIGDTPWQDARGGVGTRGESRRIEGLAFRIVGAAASEYDILYAGHFEGIGDSRVFSNGEFCGTRGQNRRLEAIRVVLRPK
jgi:hypothetical protein